VLLDGLGGDLVGEVADGELGSPEEAGVVGVQQRAGQFFDPASVASRMARARA
jgi:hypothetical protein